MGIKELWSILEPFSERKSLFELGGKTVAIDLSGWICESQNIAEYDVLPNMFLRNLYFRTCCLLMIGVVPVFVLEGSAPSLKIDTMNKRNEIKFKGCKPQTQESQRNFKSCDRTQRSSFNVVLRQCEKLLNAMGLTCVRGPGEAEAYCAYLNQQGFVHGIISQDSDCFGYGALKVYRNFCISQQNSQGGCVDIYDMDKIRQVKNIGRNHIITLALLCGCDYCPEGVGGVGRDTAMKLIDAYEDHTILNRIRSWRLKEEEFRAIELRINDRSLCTQCGHSGNLRKHCKSGCENCATSSNCHITEYREKRLTLQNEVNLRKKALSDFHFPNEDVITEFLQEPAGEPILDLSWKMPSLHEFIRIMSSVLDWEEIYCFQKFLPLITRWQLRCTEFLPKDSSHYMLKPESIQKRRKLKGIACFEVVWSDEAGVYDDLIPQDQIAQHNELNSTKLLWNTVEPEDLVKKAYPKLVSDYEEHEASKVKKKKVTSPKTKKTVISVQRTTPPKSKKNEGTLGIKQYFRVQKNIQSTPRMKLIQKPNDERNVSSLLLHMESDSDSELNLSDVINNITSRPGVLIEPLIFESKNVDNGACDNNLNHSSFFFNNYAEHDEFEKIFNNLTCVT